MYIYINISIYIYIYTYVYIYIYIYIYINIYIIQSDRYVSRMCQQYVSKKISKWTHSLLSLQTKLMFEMEELPSYLHYFSFGDHPVESFLQMKWVFWSWKTLGFCGRIQYLTVAHLWAPHCTAWLAFF